MARTFVDLNGDGNNNKAFSFPSYQVSDVKVEVDNVVKTAATHYNITSYTTAGGGTVVFTSGNIPAAGSSIRIYRDTDVDTSGGEYDPKATFAAGSSVKADDLNNNAKQALYAIAEEKEQTIQTQDIKDGAVTSAKIYDGTIVDADIANTTITGGKLVNDTITATQIAADAIGASELADNSVASANIIDGTIVNADINATAGITYSKLEDVNSAKILVGNGSNKAAPVDMSGDITITNAGVTTIGTDAVQIGNISDTETTLTANSDAKIPTSKAVADHVVDVVNSVGGFVVVPDKDNFPASHPDPNNDAGTVLSITNPNGLTVSSNTSSNGTRTGGSSTVTINNIPSDAGATLTANYTMLVQTTSTEHTYDFYKFLAKDGDVLSLSNDINDFAARYRVAASAPITGLCDATGANTGAYPCDGDMYWNTGTNKMYVFGAPAASTSTTDLQAAWAEVTSTGEFKELTVVDNGATSGTPTFGSATQFDLRDAGNSASVINKNQLIVVLNGVVQKSNAGTYSTSEEGFYLDGVDGIRFCTAPPADSTIFVTLIGSAVSVPTPGDETVTEGKLNANAPTDDHVLTADASATGGFKWAEPVSEGTQVKSTGESGGSKYLREDGDGTCSWQSVPAGVGGANGVSFDDAVEARWGDDNDLVIKESSGTAMITARSGGIIYLGAGSSGNMMNINNTQVNIIGECNLTNGNDLTVSGSGNIIIEEHATDATNGSLRFRERAANGSAYVGIKGPLDMGSDPSYTVTLPTSTPTAGKALVANASTPTTLEWGDVSSTEANGTMYKNSFIISDAHTILATEGAHSVGPITVNNTVTVNGRWVIS